MPAADPGAAGASACGGCPCTAARAARPARRRRAGRARPATCDTRVPEAHLRIEVAHGAEQVRACYPVVAELRPHLTEEQLVAQVERQREAHGYELIYASDGGRVVAAAGYRVTEHLAWGRSLYVDDLITAESARGRGFGGALLDWLLRRATELGCGQFHLDSGTHRHDAHRLYHSRKLRISSFHFSRELGSS